jgi:peptidoglycan-associated lipoprotein
MRAPRPTHALLALSLVTCAAALAACHDSPEPQSPAAGLTNAEPPRMPDLGRGAPRTKIVGGYAMYVAEPVRKVCSGSPPFFEFDSADTRGTDQPTMQTLADCMLTGPLKDRSIRLIGHTDPRGTPGYNAKLGLERAERVKSYLITHGVDTARVQLESVGEDEASPAPKDWAKDRRVEVQLAR